MLEFRACLFQNVGEGDCHCCCRLCCCYWGKVRTTPSLDFDLDWRLTKKKERKRLNDGNNNGQLRIANATSGGARKAAWAKISNNFP